jgi:hypothetical protein
MVGVLTMRVIVTTNSIKLWASARDTAEWAQRPTQRWPCSTLSGHRFFVEFDRNGLLDFALDGKIDADVDAHELSCCASDLLKLTGHVPPNHPAYFVAIAQHQPKEGN